MKCKIIISLAMFIVTICLRAQSTIVSHLPNEVRSNLMMTILGKVLWADKLVVGIEIKNVHFHLLSDPFVAYEGDGEAFVEFTNKSNKATYIFTRIGGEIWDKYFFVILSAPEFPVGLTISLNGINHSTTIPFCLKASDSNISFSKNNPKIIKITSMEIDDIKMGYRLPDGKLKWESLSRDEHFPDGIIDLSLEETMPTYLFFVHYNGAFPSGYKLFDVRGQICIYQYPDVADGLISRLKTHPQK